MKLYCPLSRSLFTLMEIVITVSYTQSYINTQIYRVSHYLNTCLVRIDINLIVEKYLARIDKTETSSVAFIRISLLHFPRPNIPFNTFIWNINKTIRDKNYTVWWFLLSNTSWRRCTERLTITESLSLPYRRVNECSIW